MAPASARSLPLEAAVVEATGLIYLAGSGAGGPEVRVLDPATNNFVAVIPLPARTGVVGPAVVNRRAGLVYFLQSPGTVAVIDARPASSTFNQTLPPLQFSGELQSLAVDETRGLLYVVRNHEEGSNLRASLVIVDADHASKTFHGVLDEVEVPGGGAVQGASVNATTHEVFVATSNTKLLAFDGATRRFTGALADVNEVRTGRSGILPQPVVVPLMGDLTVGGGAQPSKSSPASPTVVVTAAGAKCDGITDDTAAIQSALNGPATVVTIPEDRICRISSTLTFPAGAPGDGTQKILTGLSRYSSVLKWAGGATGPMVRIPATRRRVTISNLRLHGSFQATGAIGIGDDVPSTADYHTLEKLWIDGMGAGSVGITLGAGPGGNGGTSENVLRDVQIMGASIGIEVNSTFAANLLFEKLDIENHTIAGIHYRLGSGPVTIRNATFGQGTKRDVPDVLWSSPDTGTLFIDSMFGSENGRSIAVTAGRPIMTIASSHLNAVPELCPPVVLGSCLARNAITWTSGSGQLTLSGNVILGDLRMNPPSTNAAGNVYLVDLGNYYGDNPFIQLAAVSDKVRVYGFFNDLGLGSAADAREGIFGTGLGSPLSSANRGGLETIRATGKPVLVNAGGISGTTLQAKNLRGSISLSGATSRTVTFPVGQAEPDAQYFIYLTGDANQKFWITNKSTSGFTVNTDVPSNATVSWLLVR